MLDGNLASGTPLDKPITPKTTGFNRTPSFADEMHVIVMLLSASDALDKKHLDRVRSTRDHGRARGL